MAKDLDWWLNLQRHNHSRDVPCTTSCPVGQTRATIEAGNCPTCLLPQANFGCGMGQFGWFCRRTYRGRGG